jgi:hypothetical protein
MTDNNSILFFLRSHNEVDQTAPVIYKLGERGNILADIVLSSGISSDDYRITAIDRYDNVTIHGNANTTPSRTVLPIHPVEYIKELGRRISTDIPEKLYRKYIAETQLPVPDDLDLDQYSAVAFDWSLAKHYKTDYLVDRDRITTVVLPHGDSPYRNRIIKEGKFQNFVAERDHFRAKKDLTNIGFQDWQKMMDFDYILFPNTQTAMRISDPDTTEEIRVLGSPRYNEEWLEILSEIRPESDVLDTADWNIVVFVRTEQYFISKSEVEYTLQLLSKFTNIKTIVKEHPRDRLLDPSVVAEFDDIIIVKDSVDSTTLIEWGDIFLSVGTTITFEPIMRRKPVIALEYTHANHSIVSHYFSNADMRCKDDLYATIHSLLDDDYRDFYDDDEHRRFINEMITSSSTSVLDEWAECIEMIVQNDR